MPSYVRNAVDISILCVIIVNSNNNILYYIYVYISINEHKLINNVELPLM